MPHPLHKLTLRSVRHGLLSGETEWSTPVSAKWSLPPQFSEQQNYQFQFSEQQNYQFQFSKQQDYQFQIAEHYLM
jgi:hypothetical protein